MIFGGRRFKALQLLLKNLVVTPEQSDDVDDLEEEVLEAGEMLEAA